MPTVRLFLLGALEIQHGSDPLPKPPTLKSQSLLAYLARYRHRPHSRAVLADLFWGDRPERRARRSLTTALWHIRRCLPDENLLLSDAHSAQLDPDAGLWLDVNEFESLVACADLPALQSAIALYRGEFLEGFYDDWVLNERYGLETQFSDALARLMSGLEEQGETEAALAAGLQLLKHDALREDAHRLAMRAYCHLGQRRAALEQYRRCREIIRRELDAEPMAETIALYQAILDERLAVGPTAPARVAGPAVEEPALPPAHDPLDAAVRSPLVGREVELALLRDRFEQARAGHGGLLLLHGEAGVGKTRLVGELAEHLRWQGARVLVGRCYEFERLLPYQPIAEALQAALAPDALADLPTWILGELACLIPDLPERLPDLTARPVPVGREQPLLFDAVARFVAHLSQAGALALILDDLHWAADSTLQMIHYLARHLAQERVLIVGTLRPEAAGPDSALAWLERRLELDGLACCLTLAGLSPQATETMVVAMSGSQAVAPLAHRLYRETEGNPFFLIETIKMLFETGVVWLEEGTWRGDLARISLAELPLPAGVSEAIRARVHRLDRMARQALAVAAVLGREFDFDPLSTAWNQGEGATLEALDTLLRHRFVDEGSGALSRDYIFHHHKVREVVYAGIPLRHRQRLHARAAKAMETLGGPPGEAVAGELAFHFDQARHADRTLAPKAARYFVLAGDQARLAYAHREAIDYYNHALALQQEEGDYEQARRTLIKLGLVHHTGFDFAEARRAFDEAFALRIEAGIAPPASSPAAPHALRLSLSEPSLLDPAGSWTDMSSAVLSALFSGLVELGPQMDVRPDVASSWEAAEGGRRFVFRLRDNLHWNDGVRLTAHDFEVAWKRLRPGSAAAELMGDVQGSQAWQAGGDRGLDELAVRALDDLALEVELERPAGYFLYLLGEQPTLPVPRHVVRAHGPRWATPEHMVTNGPFKLADWRPGESMRLVRNLRYHRAFGGNLQEVVLVFEPVDSSARLTVYAEGGLDVTELREPAVVALARRRHPGEYTVSPVLNTRFVGFDVSRPPFNDRRVRQALVLAVDRERLASVQLQGMHAPGTGGFVPPGMAGHSPAIGLPYDPEQARHLLDRAGYPNGRGFPTIEALMAGHDVGARPEASALQGYWRENLGIEIAWQALETTAFLARLDREPPPLFLHGWLADYPDPDSFLRVSPFPHWTRWRNDAFQSLIQSARHATAQAERIKMVQQADSILVQEAPIMPLWYANAHLLVKPWVTRFPVSGMRPHGFWKDVIVAPH